MPTRRQVVTGGGVASGAAAGAIIGSAAGPVGTIGGAIIGGIAGGVTANKIDAGVDKYEANKTLSYSDQMDNLTMDGGRSLLKLNSNLDDLYSDITGNVSSLYAGAYESYFNQVVQYLIPNQTKTSDLYHANNLFFPSETNYFEKRYRFGVLNPYDNLTNCREYLFFTKPDLNIMERSASGGVSDKLCNALCMKSFWQEMYLKYPEDIAMLQASYDYNKKTLACPYNNLLGNMVNSTLTVPDQTAEMTDTPSNLYGISYSYRGSAEASDRNINFSLTFKDTKGLYVYNFFRMYEEYEILKHHGVVAPWKVYTDNKVLDDQYSIYKFLVDEDMETIVYYAKLYGVKSKTLPREIFNTTTFEDGISFTVDFEAAFFEDMNPYILAEFNKLSFDYYNSFDSDKGKGYDIGPYNDVLDRADMRPAQAAIVTRHASRDTAEYVEGVFYGSTNSSYPNKGEIHDKAPGKYVYKLRWRGTDQY